MRWHRTPRASKFLKRKSERRCHNWNFFQLSQLLTPKGITLLKRYELLIICKEKTRWVFFSINKSLKEAPLVFFATFFQPLFSISFFFRLFFFKKKFLKRNLWSFFQHWEKLERFFFHFSPIVLFLMLREARWVFFQSFPAVFFSTPIEVQHEFFCNISYLQTCGASLSIERSLVRFIWNFISLSLSFHQTNLWSFFWHGKKFNGFFSRKLHSFHADILSTLSFFRHQEKIGGFFFAKFLTCTPVELLLVPKEAPQVFSCNHSSHFSYLTSFPCELNLKTRQASFSTEKSLTSFFNRHSYSSCQSSLGIEVFSTLKQD